MLKDIQDKRCHGRINFRFAWDETLHDRLIRADNGWTILLGRGLGPVSLEIDYHGGSTGLCQPVDHGPTQSLRATGDDRDTALE